MLVKWATDIYMIRIVSLTARNKHMLPVMNGDLFPTPLSPYYDVNSFVFGKNDPHFKQFILSVLLHILNIYV